MRANRVMAGGLSRPGPPSGDAVLCSPTPGAGKNDAQNGEAENGDSGQNADNADNSDSANSDNGDSGDTQSGRGEPDQNADSSAMR
jgi:hypothetical protein